ncbi:MAG TPA: PQQ-dependent sugar dehydrogenase [Candidatus Limnocylindrales bacterium]|nr:PQQ-dependent sugar dehydrogenase [Candidatus Limnocylindrales bacterium]
MVTVIQLTCVLPLAVPGAAAAVAVVPSGFSDAEYATGFGGRLTTMTFGPGGRLFVTEKQGAIRIVENGVLRSEPFLSINTFTDSEAGLKSIAFDPNYATNRRFYIYYTDPVTILNKVSRFTTSAANPNVADPASEVVLVDGIKNGIYHLGGGLHFGSDGKLYVSTGDASYAPDAQILTNLSGKILRINTDGSIPADNPFVGQAGRRAEIWAYGLRNPFTFEFDPGSARMYVNDVGNSTWEEINVGQPGANYGWPTCEGTCSTVGMTNPLYAYNHDGPGKSITGAAFYRGSTFPAEFAGDYFFADYVGNFIKRYDVASGTVNDFATNAMNPVDLDVGPDGALYYLSVEARKINRIAFGEGTPPPPPPAGVIANGGFESTSGWPSPWFWQVRSPAQATLARDAQSVSTGAAAARSTVTAASQDWHVQLLQPNVALVAGRQHTLRFAARASASRIIRVAFQRNSSPYTTYVQQPVTISSGWQTYSFTFTPSVEDPRSLFAFNLGATLGQVWLDDVSLITSTSTGQPPAPVISAPVNGTTFRAGDQISYAGSASDPEDGAIDPADLTWEVVFHHDQHTHPFIEPFTGATGGTFVASDMGETSSNIWYRVHLTATDSDGNRVTVTRDVRPVTATVTLVTQPAGLGLLLDGSPIGTPLTFTGVINFRREISAPATQSLNGVSYQFSGWSDGGAPTHEIRTPAANTVITATYQAVGAPAIVNGDFETTGSAWLAPWLFSVRSPATSSIARDTTTAASGTTSANISITRASFDWHVQLNQPNVALAAGTPHTLSFWVRGSSARSIRAAFQRNSSPHPIYVERTVAITTAWTRYQVVFTPTTSDPRALLNFNVGANTGRVWIDGVSLTR